MASLELTKQTEMAVAQLASKSMVYLQKTLPNVKIESLVQEVRMAISKSVNTSKGTTLAECTPESLLGCMINSATMGISLNPDQKQAYLIPFRCGGKNIAQLNVSYIGLRNMIYMRTGIKMRAECVYSNEPFEYRSDGFDQIYSHTPLPESERGEFMYAFSLARDKDGDVTYERMTKEDIDKCKSASKGGHSDYSPWSKWFESMAMKSVTRRHVKNLPSMPSDVSNALANDESFEIGRPQDLTDAYEKANIEVVKDEVKTDEEIGGAFDQIFNTTAVTTEESNE